MYIACIASDDAEEPCIDPNIALSWYKEKNHKQHMLLSPEVILRDAVW